MRMFHIIQRCAFVRRQYRPTPWLGSLPLQTMYILFFDFFPSFRRKAFPVEYHREYLRLSDKGSVALDWTISASDFLKNQIAEQKKPPKFQDFPSYLAYLRTAHFLTPPLKEKQFKKRRFADFLDRFQQETSSSATLNDECGRSDSSKQGSSFFSRLKKMYRSKTLVEFLDAFLGVESASDLDSLLDNLSAPSSTTATVPPSSTDACRRPASSASNLSVSHSRQAHIEAQVQRESLICKSVQKPLSIRSVAPRRLLVAVFTSSPDGSADLHAACLVSTLTQWGFHSVVVNGRGFGAAPLSSPLLISSGFLVDDIKSVVTHLHSNVLHDESSALKGCKLALVGLGLAGSVLTKYLASKHHAPLRDRMDIACAVAVGSPGCVSQFASNQVPTHVHLLHELEEKRRVSRIQKSQNKPWHRRLRVLIKYRVGPFFNRLFKAWTDFSADILESRLVFKLKHVCLLHESVLRGEKTASKEAPDEALPSQLTPEEESETDGRDEEGGQFNRSGVKKRRRSAVSFFDKVIRVATKFLDHKLASVSSPDDKNELGSYSSRRFLDSTSQKDQVLSESSRRESRGRKGSQDSHVRSSSHRKHELEEGNDAEWTLLAEPSAFRNPSRVDWLALMAAKNLRDFDEAVSAKTASFASVESYWAAISPCEERPSRVKRLLADVVSTLGSFKQFAATSTGVAGVGKNDSSSRGGWKGEGASDAQRVKRGEDNYVLGNSTEAVVGDATATANSFSSFEITSVRSIKIPFLWLSSRNDPLNNYMIHPWYLINEIYTTGGNVFSNHNAVTFRTEGGVCDLLSAFKNVNIVICLTETGGHLLGTTGYFKPVLYFADAVAQFVMAASGIMPIIVPHEETQTYKM
eukprot:GDKJ01025747.1.p1 GENE.GDKJ01025747.1~~GDKJ01025747.1.p1  ORF type:complete len:863 (+),score=178.56 GDKJ01025747.1:234-2822(+)